MNYNELKTKSLSDDNFAKQMSCKLSDSDERASFFKWVSGLGLHWQKNPTPFEIIRKMVSKTSLNNKHILVLFNIEFVHILIDEHGVNPQDITFIADNHIEKLSANKIFKVQSYKLNDFSVPALKNLIVGLDMKFDVVFSNPPYTKNVDVKMLNEIVDIADEFIVVHPSTPILQNKDKFNPYMKFKAIKGFKCLEFFNGNNIFDIELFVPCMITHIDSNFSGKIEINFFQDKFHVDNSCDVTKYGKEWETLVKPFYKKIAEYSSKNGNLCTHNKTTILQDKFYVQLAGIRGTPNRSKSTNHMLLDDFYTMCKKDPNLNKGIWQPNLNRTTKTPVFEFTTELEQDNFVNYLCTDFARFCLSFNKINGCIFAGELELIPWFDFTEEWGDDKLFKMFDVSQDLQDYIRDFLPDFYSIRK